MSYNRKTIDSWQIHVDYGHGDGWEHEATEFSRKDARAMLKDYRANCPEYPVKVVRRRIRISDLSQHERKCLGVA